MDIVWFATAGFVLTIAFFGRELLIEGGSRKIIFGTSMKMPFAQRSRRETPVLI